MLFSIFCWPCIAPHLKRGTHSCCCFVIRAATLIFLWYLHCLECMWLVWVDFSLKTHTNKYWLMACEYSVSFNLGKPQSLSEFSQKVYIKINHFFFLAQQTKYIYAPHRVNLCKLLSTSCFNIKAINLGVERCWEEWCLAKMPLDTRLRAALPGIAVIIFVSLGYVSSYRVFILCLRPDCWWFNGGYC